MAKGPITAFGEHFGRQVSSNPATLQRFTQDAFGMPVRDLEMSMECAAALARGTTPKGEALRWCREAGRAQYGWDSKTVDRALKEASELSNPTDRIHAYLTAGNGREIPMETLQGLSELVSNYMAADMTVDLQSRLDKQRPEQALRDNFSDMPATERAKAAATDRQSIRNLVEFQMNASGREMSFEEKREAALLAREQLANRIDAGVAKVGGNSRDLRSSLRDAYDISAVREASKEVGLPDPIAGADEAYSDVRHAFDPDFDVTAALSGDFDGGK
jgi:hypothetical protein